MAWIGFDLDETLVQSETDPMTGEPTGQDVPVPGAPESTNQLAAEGHRLTIWTSRFAPMPDEARNRLKMQIEQDLAGMGFPPMEVWTGTTKPDVDVFISKKAVTFDDDWGLVLAQLQYMMEERGLVPPPMPDGMAPEEEEAPPADEEEQV
jgi:uncharacterized iron-regulated membrane protein